MLRVRAEGEEVRQDIVDAMGDALDHAETEMKLLVPVDSGRLFSSIEKSPVVFRPGGLGGGGFYEAELSIGGALEPYLQHVVEGTGDKSGQKEPGNRIYPSRGNVIPVQKHGEPVHFRKWISGQAPQTDFITAPQEIASRIIAERIHRI